MVNRKEAIKEYKQTIQPMGIYQLRNLSNGKIFIESSKNLNASKNSLLFQLKLGSYVNNSLQDEFKEMGEEQFVFEILDNLAPDKENPIRDYTEDLLALKELWLEKLQPFGEKGYNKNTKK